MVSFFAFVTIRISELQPAFHEFCRMVSRLKTNFQLCELIKVPEYAAVMRLLAQFTVESLRVGFDPFDSSDSFWSSSSWRRPTPDDGPLGEQHLFPADVLATNGHVGAVRSQQRRSSAESVLSGDYDRVRGEPSAERRAGDQVNPVRSCWRLRANSVVQFKLGGANLYEPAQPWWLRVMTRLRLSDQLTTNVWPTQFEMHKKVLILKTSIFRDGHDDPLEDQGATLQIMEHLAIICRCEYEKTAQLLANAFDENARIMEAGPEGVGGSSGFPMVFNGLLHLEWCTFHVDTCGLHRGGEARTQRTNKAASIGCCVLIGWRVLTINHFYLHLPYLVTLPPEKPSKWRFSSICL